MARASTPSGRSMMPPSRNMARRTSQGPAISMADLANSRSALAMSRRSSRRASHGSSSPESRRNSRASMTGGMDTGGTQDWWGSSLPPQKMTFGQPQHMEQRTSCSPASPPPDCENGAPRSSLRSDSSLKKTCRVSLEPPGASGEVLPRSRIANGWQTKHCKVRDRMSSLFNNWTMSDVVFHIGTQQIPAHIFVLATASPVFYTKLFSMKSGRPGSWTGRIRKMSVLDSSNSSQTTARHGKSSVRSTSPGYREPRVQDSSAHLNVVIEDFSVEVFLEFLRFVYTDDVIMDVNIVTSLVFMADEFKVMGLRDRCFAFIRTQVRGNYVLQILGIVGNLLVKAVMCLWKEVVDKAKALKQFKEMSKTERKQRMQASIVSASVSRAPSAMGSRAPSAIGASSREGSDNGTEGSEIFNPHGSDAGSVAGSVWDQGDDDVVHKLTGALGLLKNSQNPYIQLVKFCGDLYRRSWVCISEHTDLVITSNAWTLQPLKIVQTVLRLGCCKAPEIALFRAVIHWADGRCKSEGLTTLPENRRKVLGSLTIDLIRFPLMTLDQIQWEVVPTGILEFEDLAVLQKVLAKRSMMMGRFSDAPRHYPIVSWLKEHNAVSQSEKDERLQKYLESSTTLAVEMFNIDDTHKRLAPKTPTYAYARDDEVDALLGQQLLRTHIDRFVEDLSREHETTDVGEVTLELAFDPPELENDNSKVKPPSKVLGSMLMLKESWIPQDGQDDETPGIEAWDENTYTPWGAIPQPQDFHRLAKGLYYFRGDRVLEMRMEQGQAMVYEHEEDDVCDGDSDDFLKPGLEDVKHLKNEEEIRKELCLKAELPGAKAPLGAFLSRQ